jgi:hypothetical protein
MVVGVIDVHDAPSVGLGVVPVLEDMLHFDEVVGLGFVKHTAEF